MIREEIEEGLWTYALVVGRLAEAMQLWQRMPDSDARFGLSGRISSLWRQYVPERALVDAVTEEPRRQPPSRADIGRMQEATDWIVMIPERDRRMVLMALAWVAGDDRVAWMELWKAVGRGRPGPDGLRKRFGAAITGIANRLNSASEQG